MRPCVVALAILAASACAARVDAAPEPAPEEPVGGSEWRQTFMAPRVTGNLRTVAVDPSDPKSLWVGTEEGTLAHSVDGGISWDEVELSPFLLRSPMPPFLGYSPGNSVDVFAGFQFYIPPFYFSANPLLRQSASIGVPLAAPIVPPPWVFPFATTTLDPSLLPTFAAADPVGYQELVRIAVCPGAEYGVLVATKTKLHGSADGAAFAPIFATRDAAPITDVACSPSNTSEIVVATGDGTMRSVDGGASFDVMGGEVGPAASSALAFMPADKDGKERLAVAAGRDLWIGDPGDADTMKTAPLAEATHGDLRAVAATPKSIWVATDTGGIVSHDEGKTWAALDELEGSKWISVAAIASGAREHVAFLREDAVYDSVDGATFRPFFRALSRRRVRHITASADGFYVLTTGEVWTSTEPRKPRPEDEPTRRWAELRLRQTSSLPELQRRAQTKVRLTDVDIEDAASALKLRGWLPGMSLGGSFGNSTYVIGTEKALTEPSAKLVTSKAGAYFVGVNFVWELPDLIAPTYNFSAVRQQLYELKKRLAFVVEDAYDERRQVLTQIAGGGLDADELLTLQARIEVLDVVLQQLTGGAP